MGAKMHGQRFTARVTPQHNVKIPAEVPLDADKRNKVPDEVAARGLRWYVATTAPQQELRAAESVRVIKGASLLAYVPCEFFWRRPERGNLKLPKREYQRPAMRSYLFIGTKDGLSDQTLAELRARDVEGRNKHGLVSVLGSHARGALPMGSIGMTWLAKMAEAERTGATNLTSAAPFERGDGVRIASGPLAGFPGMAILVDLKAEEVVVEISLLGKATEARFPFDAVRRAACRAA